jgi:hypothetical protein
LNSPMTSALLPRHIRIKGSMPSGADVHNPSSVSGYLKASLGCKSYSTLGLDVVNSNKNGRQTPSTKVGRGNYYWPSYFSARDVSPSPTDEHRTQRGVVLLRVWCATRTSSAQRNTWNNAEERHESSPTTPATCTNNRSKKNSNSSNRSNNHNHNIQHHQVRSPSSPSTASSCFGESEPR